jgi:hypothetical protein
MSHFTTVRTQIKDVGALVKALADVGFKTVEVHQEAQHLYGYQGDIRSETAEVIVRRKHIGALSNDIGFKQQADGSFEAIISDYDQTRYSQKWLNHLMQRYAYHALMTIAPTAGFAIEEEEVLADGTIRVVVGRWV